MIRKVLTGAAIIGSLVMSTPSHAAPTLALGLGIDVSGSISAGDFILQRDAYATELNALLPTDGSIAVEVYSFDDANHLVFPLTTIDAISKPLLIAAINALVDFGGGTAIGNAITQLATDIV